MAITGSRLIALARRWQLIDTKFRQNKRRYVLQSLLATLTIMAVLLLLDDGRQTVLIASLGATGFIAFALPRSYPSKPRYIIGGYVVGTIVGCVFSVLSLGLAWAFGLNIYTAKTICAAIAVGLAFFLMVISNTEHPPAAALALGYVLNEWDLSTLVVVMTGAIAISAVKEALREELMDLV